MIAYQIQIPHFGARLFEIRLEMKQTQKQQVFSLPNWIPGSYFIRDFAKHIVTLKAYRKDSETIEEIKIEKLNNHTWMCDSQQAAVVLIYRVYAADFSVRGAYILDETTAFFNPSSLCLKAHGYEQQPHAIELIKPKGCSWRVATTLPSKTTPWEFGWYEASSYDFLIDHPVQMGIFELLEFKAAEIVHYIAVFGKQNADLERLKNDVKKCCEVHLQFFETAPFEKYLFLLMVSKDLYGGLEHQSCSALQIQRDALPILKDPRVSKGYIGLLTLFSHEYFHAWNVKRIKPKVFMNLELDKKCFTKQLWAFEGITSYYDELALVRAKIITQDQYFDLLAQSITQLYRNSGSMKQTLAESSFDAWIKFYQPNENTINAQVSYYLKGSLVALLLDIALRITSQNRFSLDDVMKKMWIEYGQQHRGLEEDDVEKIINTFSQDQLAVLIHEAIYTTEPLPLVSWLNRFGLNLNLRGATVYDDLGGSAKTNLNSSALPFEQGVFGFQIGKGPRVIIKQVLDNSAAQEAGICPLDEIIAIDGLRVDADTYDKIAKRLAVGDRVQIVLFRQDVLQERTVILKAPALDTAEICLCKNANADQMAVIQHWLKI